MLKQKKQWVLKNKELLSGDLLIAYLLRDRGVPDKSEECFFRRILSAICMIRICSAI